MAEEADVLEEVRKDMQDEAVIVWSDKGLGGCSCRVCAMLMIDIVNGSEV